MCDSPAQLQRRSDEAARRQRERYPYRRGQSRLEVFAELKHSGRGYGVAKEEATWDLEKAFRETKADQLSVLIRFYNYVALHSARYPKAISVIAGTGLVTPTF